MEVFIEVILVIEKLFGINASGERVELNFEKLVMVTKENIELQIDINKGVNKSDFSLYATHDSSNKQFKQITLYPGGCNLVSVKILTFTGEKIE